MTPVVPNPVLLNDEDLLRVVASPRDRLFTTLNRASAFAPLIVVCCILPAFQLLTNPGFNELDSMWGLRSLAVANSTTTQMLLEPGINETGQPLIFQPPAACWLNGSIVCLIGPSHPLSTSLVSLIATGIAIWLVTRCARRIGSANTGLISALLMCSHPQVLESAVVPTNCAVGLCLMLASMFSFQRYLEQGQSLVSLNLFSSGVLFGISLLAIGPIALSVPSIFFLLGLISPPRTRSISELTNNTRVLGSPALRSILILVVVGLLVGGWWELMMFKQYGSSFWRAWWTGFPKECLEPGESDWRTDVCPILQQSWRDWLTQSAMLIGWLFVGLHRCWQESCDVSGGMSRRSYEYLLLWWLFLFIGRVIVEITGTMTGTNTLVWNVALLTPSILLAALGISSLIERKVSPAIERLLIVLVASLIVSRLTMSYTSGILCALLSTMMLAFGPKLASAISFHNTVWTEAGWRYLLRVTVYLSLLGCLSAGLDTQNHATDDVHRMSVLKSRLETLPEVQRISLIASRDPIPVALRYILRSRWPGAELVTTEGWDAGLTKAMDSERLMPQSRFLVLEWTRRDIRISADTGQAWQINAVGDPMWFYGRRLSLVLIGPRN
jgi:Dolichyl-phosphate-mannose-protein mannosyltransferase